MGHDRQKVEVAGELLPFQVEGVEEVLHLSSQGEEEVVVDLLQVGEEEGERNKVEGEGVEVLLQEVEVEGVLLLVEVEEGVELLFAVDFLGFVFYILL